MISLSEQINNDAVGKFSQGIIIGLAEMERNQISERTLNGIEGGLQKGIYPFGGGLPFATSKDKDKKLFYNEDIKIVKRIYELDEKGYSNLKISKEILNEFNEKHSASKVSKILKNTIYQGYIIYRGKKYHLFHINVREK